MSYGHKEQLLPEVCRQEDFRSLQHVCTGVTQPELNIAWLSLKACELAHFMPTLQCADLCLD